MPPVKEIQIVLNVKNLVSQVNKRIIFVVKTVQLLETVIIVKQIKHYKYSSSIIIFNNKSLINVFNIRLVKELK